MTGPEGGKRSILRGLLRLALFGIAAVIVVCVLAVLNNNYSLRSPDRAAVQARIDQAIDRSTTWLASNHHVFDNPPLMFAIIDMERMSKDPRLTAMVDAYRHSEFVDGTKDPIRAVWLRMIDSGAPVPVLNAMNASISDVQEVLWDAYAVAPDRVRISDVQREHMFSRSRYWWGRRNHQLQALNMYRYFNGGSPELNTTIDHLSELVISDQFYDVRLNDSYPQRMAFVLGASRPDLIRPRWLDRLLDYQNDDGSWNSCWYYWCKGIFEFRRHDTGQIHSTPQAMWALYMLKYRFPNWVKDHYK